MPFFENLLFNYLSEGNLWIYFQIFVDASKSQQTIDEFYKNKK